MKLKIVALFCLLSFSMVTYGQGIVFTEGSWSDVLDKALKEKKPIFLDAYTVWCGPCKKLEKEIFTQIPVGEYFNKTFVSYRMDMEKGEGIELAKKYDITAFPTLLYFSEKGELLKKSVGFKDADELIKSTKEALDPKNQISGFKKEYEESDKSLKSLIIYCNKLKAADNYKMARELAVNRLGKLKKNEKYSNEEWILVSNYLRDYSSPLFKKFVVNKGKYINVADSVAINKYIYSVLANTSLFYQNKEDKGASLEKYIKAVKGLQNYINSKYFIARAEYFVHLPGPNQDSIYKYATNFLDQDYVLNYDDGKMPYFLAYMANQYVDKEGEKYAEASLRWATKSVQLDDKDYKGKFILAQLLFKQGKYDEAFLLAEDALKIEKTVVEAGVIKDLFKAKTIGAFIEKVKGKMSES